MWMFLSEDAVGRSAGGIVIDRNPGLLEREGNVRLRHAKDGDGSKRMIFDEKVEESVHGVLVPEFRDLGKSLTLQRKQLGIVYDADENRFGSRNFLPFVVPLV